MCVGLSSWDQTRSCRAEWSHSIPLSPTVRIACDQCDEHELKGGHNCPLLAPSQQQLMAGAALHTGLPVTFRSGQLASTNRVSIRLFQGHAGPRSAICRAKQSEEELQLVRREGRLIPRDAVKPHLYYIILAYEQGDSHPASPHMPVCSPQLKSQHGHAGLHLP